MKKKIKQRKNYLKKKFLFIGFYNEAYFFVSAFYLPFTFGHIYIQYIYLDKELIFDAFVYSKIIFTILAKSIDYRDTQTHWSEKEEDNI